MESESVRHSIQNAKLIEAKYKVPVSVIAEIPSCPMPWVTSPSGNTIYIIAPKDEENKLLLKVREDFRLRMDPEVIHQMYPVNELVEMTKQDNTMLRRGLSAVGFMVPFLFHREVYGGYAKTFKEEFRRNFGPQLKTEIKERFARLGMKTEKAILQKSSELKATLESKKRVFGKFEQREFSKALRTMAEKAHAEGIEVIIVLDRAARYIGTPIKRVMRDVYGKSIPVFFVDPTAAIPERSTEQIDLKEIQRQLSSDHKRLTQMLPGSKVMVIDDKVYAGRTQKAVIALLKTFKPAKIDFVVESAYRGKDFSWRQQRIYDIETAQKRLVTYRAKVSPETARKVRNMRKGISIVTNKVIERMKKRVRR
ncbi:Phosphoribosyl transferase domain protein [uncultured archaeon]|nr:Phosphoribosyl transferase domain protein [uncultured archaeon]